MSSGFEAGSGWTEEIRDGLSSSLVLIALLTPHAVRRVGMPGNPDNLDSICLDEIRGTQSTSRAYLSFL